MARALDGNLTQAHARTPDEIMRALGVDPARGLTSAESAARLASFGPNQLEPTTRPSVLCAIWEAATEPFILLLAAAGVGAVLLGETRDGLLVLGGLVPIVGAAVATTYRSERALEALRTAAAPRAHVLRDGRRAEVSAADVVPGDVLLLATGDVVPADARILEASGLLVDRSVLTGESIPEAGSVAPDPAGAPLTERRAMLYAGTSIVGGRASAVAVATGQGTELGRIAGGLGPRERGRSPLQRELDRLVRILLVAAIVLIAITTGLGFARGQPAGANVLAGISAAIAAIPEEPPVLLAVILGLGAYRLLRRGVLVRRLSAQETLGAVDLIITDKTGTLTHNRLELAAVLHPDGPVDEADLGSILTDALRAEEDAWIPDHVGRRGSFTGAIEAALAARGLSPSLDPTALRSAEAPAGGRPYSRVSHFVERGEEVELALGAPEAVLGFAEDLPAGELRAWIDLFAREAARGGRLLLLATRRAGGRWRPRAVLAFADTLRPEVPNAMAMATAAGIQTLVVTGDHTETAAAIARAAGLAPGLAVTGAELDSQDDDALGRMLAELRIVARAVPEQKLRLVRLARARGRTVAVTGDGVNDAPALHNADVAVAMGSGTAVAREASDLVLGDDSFGTLMQGLREGRRMVANVQKGLVFLISTHVALLGFILVATVAGYGQPLLPLQILWLELFIDLSTSVAFEREPEEPDAMRRPPRPRGEPLLGRGLLARIGGAGGFSALAALAVIELSPTGFEHARWVAYTALVVGQLVRAYANRRLDRPVYRLPPNVVLAAACVIVVVIQLAIPAVPPLATAFHATPLSATEWLVVIGIGLLPAIVAEVARTLRPGRTWIA